MVIARAKASLSALGINLINRRRNGRNKFRASRYGDRILCHGRNQLAILHLVKEASQSASNSSITRGVRN